ARLATAMKAPRLRPGLQGTWTVTRISAGCCDPAGSHRGNRLGKMALAGAARAQECQLSPHVITIHDDVHQNISFPRLMAEGLQGRCHPRSNERARFTVRAVGSSVCRRSG